jgi:hypothetical protein
MQQKKRLAYSLCNHKRPERIHLLRMILTHLTWIGVLNEFIMGNILIQADT